MKLHRCFLASGILCATLAGCQKTATVDPHDPMIIVVAHRHEARVGETTELTARGEHLQGAGGIKWNVMPKTATVTADKTDGRKATFVADAPGTYGVHATCQMSDGSVLMSNIENVVVTGDSPKK